ncbi:MAG TPA: FoF1 ATP synthase subunit gamma [Chloroflexota bacterium]|nr:FoF1 ATP synthase subunit gamma [Chloroflexota bacterium]
MSVPLEELAEHRKSIEGLIPFLEAIRSIAEIAWRRAEKRSNPLAEYERHLQNVLAILLAYPEAQRQVQQISAQTDNGRVGLLVVSSGRGLCGSFNERLVTYSLEQAATQIKEGKEVRFLCLGARGQRIFETRGQPLIYRRNLPSLTVPSYSEIEQIALDLLGLEEQGEFSQLIVVRNAPIRRFQYAPASRPLLPPEIPPPVSRMTRSPVKPTNDLEPLLAQVLTEQLLVGLYRAIMESTLSEQLARVFTMRMGTDGAKKMLDDLTMQYNAASRQAITNSLLEIIAGYEASGH